jgi:lysyl-tRNA synthetase class 2
MSRSWQPGARVEVLRARAQLLARVRAFFADSGVLEVETPVLVNAGVTDPNMSNLVTACQLPGEPSPRTLYLQTSPEYAMKRLLAAGSGPIYQICKVFRDGESGQLHNLEFTMVEWYRPGFGYDAIMDDTEALLRSLLRVGQCERMTYADAFHTYASIDALAASIGKLKHRAAEADIDLSGEKQLTRDGWLDLLLSHIVAPHLGVECPLFLTEFPASQAALARLSLGNPAVAERFEVYVKGVEIANGFHELLEPVEQRRRFLRDNQRRRKAGLPSVRLDERLLGALAAGLPDCSGVAIGLDRLLMMALELTSIAEALAFSTDRA